MDREGLQHASREVRIQAARLEEPSAPTAVVIQPLHERASPPERVVFVLHQASWGGEAACNYESFPDSARDLPVRIGGSTITVETGGMAGRRWLDWLYPRFCAGCGGVVQEPDRHLCWDCRTTAQFIQPPYCDRCGDPVAGRVDRQFICALCAKYIGGFDIARSVVRHEGVIAQAIRDVKYHAHLWLVPDLVDLLEAGVRSHFQPFGFNIISWIPLYPARQRERGFNQAAELARALAVRLTLPAIPTALRIRATRTQTRLTLAERAVNVRNAFRPMCAGRWRGARVLLVDDVMTTGATAHACAQVLREGGAEYVGVITVSRG